MSEWDWLRTEEAAKIDRGFFYRAADARYVIVPDAIGNWSTFRLTGFGDDWASEYLGTYIFAGNAKEACYERARREAWASAQADSGRVDRASTEGEGK